MPDGHGHYHAFVPMKNETPGDPSLRQCGWCMEFPDDRVHQPRPGADPIGSDQRNKPIGLLVKCPECGASVGQRCFNKSTHRSLRTQHLSRLRAQRRALGPGDTGLNTV